MDFNPRWVADATDFDLGRQRQNDWMAVIVGDAATAAGGRLLRLAGSAAAAAGAAGRW
jgi:sigma-54 specific flagellar transcriptional regulator A